MASFVRAARSNAHVMNYVVLGMATLVPVLLYANMRSPSAEAIEAKLVRDAVCPCP